MLSQLHKYTEKKVVKNGHIVVALINNEPRQVITHAVSCIFVYIYKIKLNRKTHQKKEMANVLQNV